jgi:hypothetical protein
MRKFAFWSLLLIAGLGLAGCGDAHGIEEGVPEVKSPPPDFDPGGEAVPDMKGKKQSAVP